jgi:GNAT superfamily N-acetyltransferase
VDVIIIHNEVNQVSSQDPLIRVATVSDLPAIVALNAALFLADAGQRDPFMDLDWPHKEGNEYFTSLLSSQGTHCLIAEAAGKPIGYLVGFIREESTLRPARMAELQSMFVEHEYRNLGLGSRLVTEFFAWCRDQAVVRVAVTAYAANQGAVRFYSRMGFEPKELTLECGL